MNPQTWWYVARASGIVSWSLLAGSVWLGLALSSRALGRRPSPAWLLDLHRGVSGLAVVFTGVHVAALVLDDAVTFRLVDLLVPMASEWRPGAVAWGVVAMYLLLAVEVSSLLRRRLGTRTWRRIHALSFPLAIVASVHLLMAGSEAHNPVLLGVLFATMLAAAALALLRIKVLRERTIARATRTRRRDATATPPRADRRPTPVTQAAAVSPRSSHSPGAGRPPSRR